MGRLRIRLTLGDKVAEADQERNDVYELLHGQRECIESRIVREEV
jgi:hypothetical protein